MEQSSERWLKPSKPYVLPAGDNYSRHTGKLLLLEGYKDSHRTNRYAAVASIVDVNNGVVDDSTQQVKGWWHGKTLQEISDILETVILAQEPIGDTTIIPYYYVPPAGDNDMVVALKFTMQGQNN